MTPAPAIAWQAPDLRAAHKPVPTLAELQDIEHSARLEGYAAGHAEGLAQGQAEVRKQLAHLSGLIDSFSRPLAQLDAELQAVLCDLAVQVSGVLIGPAYQSDPQLLADLVGQAVIAAGQTTRPAEVKLHPADLAAVEPLLMQAGLALEARLLPDPALARGDIRVHTDTLRLDGSIAARLQAVLAAFQGGGES
jgi:flagellar assembly protein FliH